MILSPGEGIAFFKAFMENSGTFIGVLDSGVGGLTVWHEARNALPDHNFLYYADRDHAPYGEKTRAEILDLTLQCVSAMETYGLQALVIACNTATSAAVRELRKIYDFPVIGMEPAVKPAISHEPNKRVLVLATPLTLKEEKFRKLVDQIDRERKVDCIAMPELVRFAESGIFSGEPVERYLFQQLNLVDWSEYSTVVLGCTHFIYFKDCLRSYLPNQLTIIDGNAGTIRQLKRQVSEGVGPAGQLKFLNSGKEVKMSNFQRWLDFLEDD